MPFDPQLYSGDESDQDLHYGDDSPNDAAFEDSFLDDMMQELGGQLTADSNRLSQIYPGQLPSRQSEPEPELEQTISTQATKRLATPKRSKRVVGGGLLSLAVLLGTYAGWHALQNGPETDTDLPSATALITEPIQPMEMAVTKPAQLHHAASVDVQPVGLDAEPAVIETHEASYQDLEFLREASEAELEAMYDIWEEDDKASFEI